MRCTDVHLMAKFFVRIISVASLRRLLSPLDEEDDSCLHRGRAGRAAQRTGHGHAGGGLVGGGGCDRQPDGRAAAALRAVVGSGVGPVRDGRWWTVLTSLPWCAQLLGYVATSLAVVALLPFAERRLGAARTVAAALALQVVGVLGGCALVGLSRGGTRWVTQLDHTVMLGPSAAVVGVVLLASAGFGPLWRRRARLLLLSGLAMMALYSGMLGDVLRLGTGLVGLLAGMATLGRQRDTACVLPAVIPAVIRGCRPGRRRGCWWRCWSPCRRSARWWRRSRKPVWGRWPCCATCSPRRSPTRRRCSRSAGRPRARASRRRPGCGWVGGAPG